MGAGNFARPSSRESQRGRSHSDSRMGNGAHFLSGLSRFPRERNRARFGADVVLGCKPRHGRGALGKCRWQFLASRNGIARTALRPGGKHHQAASETHRRNIMKSYQKGLIATIIAGLLSAVVACNRGTRGSSDSSSDSSRPSGPTNTKSGTGSGTGTASGTTGGSSTTGSSSGSGSTTTGSNASR